MNRMQEIECILTIFKICQVTIFPWNDPLNKENNLRGGIELDFYIEYQPIHHNVIVSPTFQTNEQSIKKQISNWRISSSWGLFHCYGIES